MFVFRKVGSNKWTRIGQIITGYYASESLSHDGNRILLQKFNESSRSRVFQYNEAEDRWVPLGDTLIGRGKLSSDGDTIIVKTGFEIDGDFERFVEVLQAFYLKGNSWVAGPSFQVPRRRQLLEYSASGPTLFTGIGVREREDLKVRIKSLRVQSPTSKSGNSTAAFKQSGPEFPGRGSFYSISGDGTVAALTNPDTTTTRFFKFSPASNRWIKMGNSLPSSTASMCLSEDGSVAVIETFDRRLYVYKFSDGNWVPVGSSSIKMTFRESLIGVTTDQGDGSKKGGIVLTMMKVGRFSGDPGFLDIFTYTLAQP